MADDEMRDKEAADDLDPAFDSIDATMRGAPRRNIKVTPEALAQIVNEAVEKAISAYEQSRREPPESAGTSEAPAAAPLSPWRAKIKQLQGDMGLDEIEFDHARAEPVETSSPRELSSQMGVHDFEFEDAPGAAAEPEAPTRTEADAIAGWALQAEDASPAAPVVDETPAPAAAEHAVDPTPEFDWVAAELGRLDAEEIPTPVNLEPARNRALEAVAPAIEAPPAAPMPEVQETLSSLASWFRSALGDKSPEREPAAAVAVPEPEAPVMPAPAAPEARVPAAAEPPAHDPEHEFNWITAALEAGRVKGEPSVAPKPEVRAVTKPGVHETVRKPAANTPEVKETRRSLASWFRPAPAKAPQARVPEPAAVLPVPQPKARAVPEVPPAPAPPPVAPPPVAARPEPKPKPAPEPNPTPMSLTPKEAATTVSFTFDPIPPVPSRLPREPKDPPKASSVRRSGKFL